MPLPDLKLRAWNIHRANGHPPGYVGPCWGPTAAELEEAKKELSDASLPPA